jgi:hypothetical protein
MGRTSSEPFEGHTVVRTADIDEAQDAMQRVYLPLTVKYLEDPAPLDMRLAAVQVGSATAGYARFGRDIRMVTADADWSWRGYHVNIPLPEV